MEFSEWEPWYEKILGEFGYSRKKDRRSARILGEIRGTDSLSSLRSLENEIVEVAGPFFSRSRADITIAAGAAVEQVDAAGVTPDLIVTDIDGDKELQLDLNLKGTPVVMHAHGDNISMIKSWAQKFGGPVISTCQCEPLEPDVYNFGGFTDGDRACFIADHFMSKKILLNGWDFDKPFKGRDSEKRRKLIWAKRLLEAADISWVSI